MKASLRRSFLAARRSLPPEDAELLSREIWARLREHPVFRRAEIVLFYMSIGGEVRTQGMIAETLAGGKRVALPSPTSGGGMVVAEIFDPSADITETLLGCPCPPPDSDFLIPPLLLDLAVVPGVGFDPAGHRLGRGAGCYDVFLADLPELPTIGLAYEFQIAEVLPREPHDRDMNWIITEGRVIDCAAPGACSDKSAAGGTTEK